MTRPVGTEHAEPRRRAPKRWPRPAHVALGVLVLGVVLGGAAVFRALYAGRGANVVWRAEVDGETREVARTIERRAQFPNDRRALSRYVQGWDFARDGVPAELFPFEAEVRTTLDVPAGGRELHVRNAKHRATG